MLYLTLRQIEYVVAVARAGSLSAAASVLNVSQPSLSVALSQVESSLGQKLFVRNKGAPLRLTTFATRYVVEAEALLAMARRLEDPEVIRRTVNGSLTLGCFEDLAPYHLAPILQQLRAFLPGVDLGWRIADFETLARDMRDGRIDLALTYDLGLDSTFSRKALAQAAPFAFFSNRHALAARASVTLAEIAGEPLILFDELLSNRHALQLFRGLGLSPAVAHRVRSLEIMRSLAANGEGVGISYTRPPGDLSYDGARVVAVAISDPVAREPVILARSGGTPEVPVVAAASATIAALFVDVTKGLDGAQECGSVEV